MLARCRSAAPAVTVLANVPVRRIIGAIADAAERWADADFPPRVRLLEPIAERTGYAIPAIEYALDQLFFSMTRSALETTIANELGSLDALEGGHERAGGGRFRARPIGRVAVISSRTTIGVAIVPAIFALCAKCDVVVKDREDGLVRAFFASLAEELDSFAEAAKADVWDGESGDVDLKLFDAVVAFGSDETMGSLRAGVSPLARFIPYGSKASLGYVAREALTHAAIRNLAEAAARDLVLYETEGCLSLHALFVERGGEIDALAAASHFAAAVERAAVEFPIGRREAASAARVAAARNLAAFRSASDGSPSAFSDANASFLVMADPPLSEPPAFLPRTLAIHTVDGPAAALDYVRAHRLPVEAVAVAGSREDIVNMALDMGADRIARFGDLQSPPLGTMHGGRPRIAEFVRMIASDA